MKKFKNFVKLIILLLHVFLTVCSRQSAFNDFGGVVSDLYNGNRFERVASPFQFCDRFSFQEMFILSFLFFLFLIHIFLIYILSYIYIYIYFLNIYFHIM